MIHLGPRKKSVRMHDILIYSYVGFIILVGFIEGSIVENLEIAAYSFIVAKILFFVLSVNNIEGREDNIPARVSEKCF